MHAIRVGAALAALAVLVAGCSGGDDTDPDPRPSRTVAPRTPEPSPTEHLLPVPITNEQPGLLPHDYLWKAPDPEDDELTVRRVLQEMGQRTQFMGGFAGPTKGQCKGGRIRLGKGAKTICTIEYRGVKVEWLLLIGDDYTGVGFYRYSLFPRTGMLTAQGVYGRFWENFKPRSTELRCDRIPEIATVKDPDDTGYRCQYMPVGFGVGWETVKVTISDEGVVQFPPVNQR